MMYLRTGTPGAGKTLSTIDEVNERAKEEGRNVYYCNVDNLNLEGWYKIENPENWNEDIPAHSIFFCDEFYEVFPKLGTTAKRPDSYTMLAKHRHKALDVYLICQGVQQIDDFLKPLFENHHHLVRSEMLDTSKVFKSKGIMTSPHTPAGRRHCETSTYKFNKKLYGCYKSAEAHTYKKRIPKYYKYLVIAFFILGFSLFYLFNFFLAKTTKTEDSISLLNEQPSLPPVKSKTKNSSLSSFSLSPVSDDFNPIFAYKPRISNMPETAPAYDELRQPKSFPKPNCVSDETRCICYTQQATLMHNYPEVLCRDFVKNGRFEPTKEDVTTNNVSPAAAGAVTPGEAQGEAQGKPVDDDFLIKDYKKFQFFNLMYDGNLHSLETK